MEENVETKQNNPNRLITILLFLLVLAVSSCAYLLYRTENKDDAAQTNQNLTISNFQDCVSAGNPILESYPEKCIANGQTYVNEDNDVSNGLQTEAVSGQGAFTMNIPDGWVVNNVQDSDWFSINGTNQPEFKVGTAGLVNNIESYGGDGQSLFGALVIDSDGYSKEEATRGTSEEFSIGKAEEGLKGKKYVYEYPSDTLAGIGYLRLKSDRDYYYVFELPENKTLLVHYSVYGSDPRNNIEKIDDVVRSIRLQ